MERETYDVERLQHRLEARTTRLEHIDGVGVLKRDPDVVESVEQPILRELVEGEVG